MSHEFEEPEEGDLVTNDHIIFWQDGKAALQVSRGASEQEMWNTIEAFMERENFFPNVWFVSDHGNAHLMSRPQRGGGKRMSHYGNEYEEEKRAAERRAAEAQARYDREGEIEYKRKYPETGYAEEELARARTREGTWRFDRILNESGRPIGATASLDGNKVGILLLRGADLMVLSTSTDREALRKAGVFHLVDDPSPAEIMAAFMRMYPEGELIHERAALPASTSNRTIRYK